MTRILRDYSEGTFRTQLELSRRTGIRQQRISDVFLGKGYFTLEEIVPLCQALGVPPLAVINEAIEESTAGTP